MSNDLTTRPTSISTRTDDRSGGPEQPLDIIGTVRNYADLRALVAARRKELDLTQLEVDDLAGVQSGYTGKIECGARNFGEMSFDAIMGALGLSVALMSDVGTYGDPSIEAPSGSRARLREKRRKMGATGGRNRAAKLTAKQRADSARRAAKKRWRDWRAVKSEQKRKAKANFGLMRSAGTYRAPALEDSGVSVGRQPAR